jgi:hypothetical protein
MLIFDFIKFNVKWKKTQWVDDAIRQHFEDQSYDYDVLWIQMGSLKSKACLTTKRKLKKYQVIDFIVSNIKRSQLGVI